MFLFSGLMAPFLFTNCGFCVVKNCTATIMLRADHTSVVVPAGQGTHPKAEMWAPWNGSLNLWGPYLKGKRK